MKIAVNTRLLIKGKMEGIGWFGFESLKRISIRHPEHEFLFIFDRPFDPSFVFAPNVKAVYAGPPTRHILLFIPWFEFILPRILKKHKADVFLSLDGHLSLRTKVPSIPVIHDLNFYHHPEQVPAFVRWYYNWFFPRFAKKAVRIATVSEYTKQDIVKAYGIDPRQIDVVYNGCNERYAPVTEDVKSKTRNKLTGGQPYFLFIGLIIPRKNIHRLLLAFDQFKVKTGSKVKLVIVGEKKWWDAKHEEAFQGMTNKGDVIFTGRMNPDELGNVLGSALALTYIPVFEGFGIPILEGFASGIPVLTANVTSMPEVAGEAALLTDPYNIDAIAENLKLLEDDETLRTKLILKGYERLKMFSWDNTSARLWDVIEQATSAVSP